MLKYRLQWPFELVDCYECGKGLHFRPLWMRVYKRTPLPAGALEMIISSARIVGEYNSSPVFSKAGLVNISEGKTISVPKVGNWDVFGAYDVKPESGVEGHG